MPEANNPPPDVQEAAAKVQAWLDGEAKRTRSPEERAAMTPAQQLDYCRGFDQTKMPRWQDPRKGA